MQSTAHIHQWLKWHFSRKCIPFHKFAWPFFFLLLQNDQGNRRNALLSQVKSFCRNSLWGNCHAPPSAPSGHGDLPLWHSDFLLPLMHYTLLHFLTWWLHLPFSASVATSSVKHRMSLKSVAVLQAPLSVPLMRPVWDFFFFLLCVCVTVFDDVCQCL